MRPWKASFLRMLDVLFFAFACYLFASTPHHFHDDIRSHLFPRMYYNLSQPIAVAFGEGFSEEEKKEIQNGFSAWAFVMFMHNDMYTLDFISPEGETYDFTEWHIIRKDEADANEMCGSLHTPTQEPCIEDMQTITVLKDEKICDERTGALWHIATGGVVFCSSFAKQEPRYLRKIAMHEFGHALGLHDHSENEMSIMYKSLSSPDGSPVSLIRQEDLIEVCTLHPEIFCPLVIDSRR